MKYIPHLVVVMVVCVVVLITLSARTVQFTSPVIVPQQPLSVVPLPKPLPQIIEVEKEKAPIVKPVESKPVSLPPTVATPLQKPPADIPINLRSVVVVKCLFKNGEAQATAYGSGVIINTEGYVMTARHVVDMVYASKITGGKQGLVGYTLDSCRIAVPPEGTETPTPTEIRTLNSFTLVTEFAYHAQIAFIPPDPSASGMSEAEYNFADSALLRIKSAVNGTLPHSFIASPVQITDLPQQKDEIISFGFPSGVPSYGNNFYLQGSVGALQDIVGGDQLFKDKSMGMTATMETIGGRSGSPVFWHGMVIGIISSKEDHSRNTLIAGVYPLVRFAEDAGKKDIIR